MAPAHVEQAIELMARFADRTGLGSARAAKRYLWTDAFAVCNYLELARLTGDDRHRERALQLIDQVHHHLGRHRGDDGRAGWISGLDPRAGEAHPTAGGLRIGKPLPERGPGEPFDERREWDRDGQYFHYLTKWMHALDQAAWATGRRGFNLWARELAAAAHAAFTYRLPGGALRMRWKLSIDLSRPLVASMGQHDPLDGLVTAVQLDASAGRLGGRDGPALRAIASECAAMLDPRGLATSDPLGLGGLLADARRIAQLMRQGAWTGDDGLLASVLAAAALGLRHLERPSHRPEHRLAFRELGLAIGLAGVGALGRDVEHLGLGGGAGASVDELARHVPAGEALVAFWSRPEHQRTALWLDHADIDDVMLATALVPDGFLALARADAP